MTNIGRLEFAKAPDRSADPASWTWTDATADTRSEAISIRRGRSEGAQQTTPGSFTIPMYNGDGRYTPRNPSSVHYPDIVRGLPVRHSIKSGARYLATTSAAASRASTPDAASLDITGDIAGAFEFRSPLRVPRPGFFYMPAGKSVSAGDQRSWFCFLHNNGGFGIQWYVDGTTATVRNFTTQLAIPRPDAGPLTVGWYLDADNGAAGRTIVFYVGRVDLATLVADPAAYTFETFTLSGTTSIFSSTAPLEVGGCNGAVTSTLLNYPGGISRFLLRSGTLSGGTIVANPDFTTQTAGAGSFVDTAAVPKTWTINAPAEITDRKITMLGELQTNAPSWPAYGVEDTAQVTWEVTGILRRLQQGGQALHSALRRLITGRINADAVVAYWPMEDGSDATQAASGITGQLPMTASSTVRFGADSTFVSSSPLPSVSSGDAASWQASIADAPAETVWHSDMFFKIVPGGTGTGLYAISTSGTAQFTWWIDNINVNWLVRNSVGATLDSGTFSTNADFTGVWAIAALDWAQNGGNIDFNFGIIPIEGDSAGSVFQSGVNSVAGTVGVPTGVAGQVITAPPDGYSFGHVVVSHGLLNGWLAPADTAYVGEPPGSRFFRLCQEEGIQGFVDGTYGVLWDNVTAASSPFRVMGPQRPLPLVTLLEECADVAAGYFGESHETLGLTLRDYESLVNQTPRLTLGRELTNPFVPADDDQRMVNDATAKRTNGSTARVVDQASIDASGVYEDTKEYNVETDGTLGHYANWRLTQALWPEMRLPNIPATLVVNDGALVDSWLDTTLGDVVEANQLPDEYPTSTLAQVMEGYTQTISAVDWTVDINGIPAGPYTAGILDEASPDTDLARLATDASELDAGIDDNDMTASVEVTDGPEWTQDAGDFPLDIEIGGERITVSAIGAPAAGVQAFTFSARSVNGVVRSHSAGAAVQVADPFRLTL